MCSITNMWYKKTYNAHYLGVCHIYHLRYNCNCCFNDVWADIKHISITLQTAQIEIVNWKYD